jgi:hypothetical protein
MACLFSAPERKGPMMTQIAVAQALHVSKPEGRFCAAEEAD